MATPTQTEPLQLSVSNFGPIAKAEIDLRPLTVFVGPSNTGKSYLAILIYALHRFFGEYTHSRYFRIGQRYPTLRRSIGNQQPFDDNSVRRLVDWMRDVFVQIDAENQSNSSLVQLPDFIGSMVHHLFNDLGNFIPYLAEEIERSFGIADTARLIRHGNREGAKIALHFKPFAYELALKRGRFDGGVISVSEETPLYIDPHTMGMEEVLFVARVVLDGLERGDDGRGPGGITSFISQLSSLVLPNVVSPLSNAAHYLPADRTGVMHAHRVVVASLIESASRAGLRRGTALPALSGVLADFLENLVGLGELGKRRNNEGNLAANLEQQILRGGNP